MENMKCVIITEEKNYGDHLSRCLRRVGAVNISVLTSKDNLGDYSYIIVDMETVSQAQFEEISAQAKNNSLCIKMEDRPSEENQGEILLKYEPLSKWISKAIKIYAKERGDIFINPAYRKETKVISVLSSAGGMGATSIAMAVACDFSYCGGKKVLYLSLSSLCQELEYFHKKTENNFRSFLYKRHMEGEDVTVEDFMERNQYGVYSFNMSNMENPLKYLKKEHLEEFFRKLITEDGFDLIVFDIGKEISDVSRLAISLSLCKIFLQPKENDSFYEEFLNKCSYDIKKDFLVENFAYQASKFDQFFEEDDVQENEAVQKIKIVKDPDAFQLIDGIKSLDLNTSFGVSVRNLINNI